MPLFSSPLLVHLPVSSFAMVMGLSGLALVWGRVSVMGWLPSLAPIMANGLGLLAGLVFFLRSCVISPDVSPMPSRFGPNGNTQ